MASASWLVSPHLPTGKSADMIQCLEEEACPGLNWRVLWENCAPSSSETGCLFGRSATSHGRTLTFHYFCVFSWPIYICLVGSPARHCPVVLHTRFRNHKNGAVFLISILFHYLLSPSGKAKRDRQLPTGKKKTPRPFSVCEKSPNLFLPQL